MAGDYRLQVVQDVETWKTKTQEAREEAGALRVTLRLAADKVRAYVAKTKRCTCESLPHKAGCLVLESLALLQAMEEPC